MARSIQQIGDQISLSYLDTGRGKPLLLIHGFTGTAESHMGPIIEWFQGDHRIIAPDLRGYGASRPPNRDFPADFYQRDAQDVAALLRAIDVGPVTVLGFSDGAEVAILLAALYPGLVRGVIAWGVSGVISPEELANVERWLPVSAWGEDRQQWRQEIIEHHGIDQFESMITGWVMAARAIRAAGGNICYEESDSITCPTLLLNGDGEVGNTLKDVKALAARIPKGRLEIISDSGHMIQHDQPEKLLNRIRSFLESTAG